LANPWPFFVFQEVEMNTKKILTTESTLFILWIAALIRWIAELTHWIAALIRWIAALMSETPQLASTQLDPGWDGTGRQAYILDELPAAHRPSRPRKAPALPRRRDLRSKAHEAALR
jgi:hypothetical protein